jgi:hypothetical protein
MLHHGRVPAQCSELVEALIEAAERGEPIRSAAAS